MGRLPTESEWEYAAAGGNEERLYPWGSAAPTGSLANLSTGGNPKLSVGSLAAGEGRWGHRDLAGGMWEWNLDWYAGYGAGPVTDFANTTPGTLRVLRGGSWFDIASTLRAAARYSHLYDPLARTYTVGWRCSRG